MTAVRAVAWILAIATLGWLVINGLDMANTIATLMHGGVL